MNRSFSRLGRLRSRQVRESLRAIAWLLLFCLSAGTQGVRAAELNQALPNEIQAGPIWNEGDAQKKCPNVCAQVQQPWSGLWRTTVWGQMSVCSCFGGAGAAPAAIQNGAGSACTAPATEDCGGCAVTCPAGKHASCKQGARFSADTPGCWDKARCACD
jgi:hypothetical protein